MSAFASVAFCGTTTSPFLLERRHIRVLCSYWRCQKWRACLLYTFFISATSLMYLPQDMNGVAEHDTRTTLQDLFQLIAVQDLSTHPWRSNIKVTPVQHHCKIVKFSMPAFSRFLAHFPSLMNAIPSRTYASGWNL